MDRWLLQKKEVSFPKETQVFSWPVDCFFLKKKWEGYLKNKPNTLIVYFSRTGRTEKVVDRVKETLQDCKKEPVRELIRRNGPLGYLRSLWEATVGATPIIQRPENDPSQFDLLILASPVWMSRVASPMKTYLNKMEAHFPKVAFVVTEGGSGGNRALLQMRDLCSRIPIAELVITEDEIAKGNYIHRVDTFCEQIESHSEKETITPPSMKKSMS